jgi:relaxase-like protein
MITRPIKGRGFRGLLNYLAEKDHAQLFGGNMAGRNPRELAHEFGLVRRQRPGLKRAAAHMFLRPAPGEYLTDEQWRNVATYFLAGMGFTDSPYVLYMHGEPHPHLHIVASRISYAGKVVSDSNDYARADVLLRNIERQYGLRLVPTHPELAAPSRGDFGRSRRTKTPPVKTRLQEILGKAPYPLTLAEYLDHLHRHGVTLLPNIARTGRVSGISYVYEGHIMKASDLGRQHSWAALERRLIATPGDSALLAAERARAQDAFGPPSAGRTVAQPAAAELETPFARWTREIPGGTVSERAHEILASIASAERRLLESSPESFHEHLWDYLQTVDSTRRRVLQSFTPGEGAPLSQTDFDASREVARILLLDGSPPPLTLTNLTPLLDDSKKALRSLLESPEAATEGPQAIARFFRLHYELDRNAVHTAVALEALSSQPALAEDQYLEASYLQVIVRKIEIDSVVAERDVRLFASEDDLRSESLLDACDTRIVELCDDLHYLESLPRPARVADFETPLGVDDDPPAVHPLLFDAEDVHLDVLSIAESFRSESRFTSQPPFLLAPTTGDLPALAREAREAFESLASAESRLREAAPHDYLNLALSHAAFSAAAESLEQRLATFGPEPIPRDLAPKALSSFLETRLELHEILAAPPSVHRDLLTASLAARLAELSAPPPAVPLSQERLSLILAEDRRAYDELREHLTSPPQDPAVFQAAVGRALDRHAELERFSIRLEGHLHALEREHALVASRLPGDSAEHPRLQAIERRIGALEPLYQQARIAIADRDLELLERHLGRHPSSEALDRYTEILEDRTRLFARLRESPSATLTAIPDSDPGATRHAFLQDPTAGNLQRHRLATIAATEAEVQGTFVSARAAVSRASDELQEAIRQADRRQSALPASSGQPKTDLRQAANRYLDTRAVLADHAPRPSRRGDTFDYAAHARATDLAPEAIEHLRRSALRDFRRAPSPNPITRRPSRIPPGLSRDEALSLAAKRLRAAEANLNAQLRGFEKIERQTALPASPPRATPETYGRLIRGIDRYRDALAQVDRLARPRTLFSPRQFLTYPAFQGRPRWALAAWTRHASREGLTARQVQRSLRSFALPFAAGAAARGAQNLATRFLQDQVHER